MTIYYNPAYSAAPHRNISATTEFGNIYCGDIQLLERLLFYAGIPLRVTSSEERIVHYHNNIRCKITPASLFYNSFSIDSVGMSRTVLEWRDALVEAGWDLKTYAGDSPKLTLIRDIEPEDIPLGNADYWHLLKSIASERRILSTDDSIVVTCKEEHIKPHIAYILAKQQEAGISVEFRPTLEPNADGNLGKIQHAVLNRSTDKILLDTNDNTFTYVKFDNEDEVLRYVATEAIDPSAVYFCSKPKRFDNTLRLLGKPTIGSSLSSKLPQVVQLFTLGNGLFEFPLNVQRIIEWLNLPLSPIPFKLRLTLSRALTKSGGINNADWNDAKKKYFEGIEDTKRRDKECEQLEKFMPIPDKKDIDVERVKAFNKDLHDWAAEQLAKDNNGHNEVIREQLASVVSYCNTLLKMLDGASEEFRFLDLQLWCRQIAKPGTYGQYDAEVNSHNAISSIGDIHDTANHIVWFPAEDSIIEPYPFEILNDAEYKDVESGGAMLCTREQHSKINECIMLRILLNTQRLTIIEAEKSNGEMVARHPLVLQLQERINDGLDKIATKVTLSEAYLTTDSKVNNHNPEHPELVTIDNAAMLKERYERHTDEKLQAESYSSIESLIQHPFTYVCEKCAQLEDQEMPSAADINLVQGKVSHLIIEKVFDNRDINEACDFYQNNYDTIFDEAINETGLVLLLPEQAITLRGLKMKMKSALRKLSDFIKGNSLSNIRCEHDFKIAKWSEAGENVTLGSRADMLLDDNRGGKVIFDFKYSNLKSRATQIEENRALQLEVYRYMAKKEFGERTPVRVAFIHLPDVAVFTADEFADAKRIDIKEERKDKDVMKEAANSYRFRWEQLKRGDIERVEGCAVGTGEYAKEEVNKGLYPLETHNKTYNENKFDKGYKNLK